ncbi:MAG: WYL domain-containing protein [Chloroflexi bacterium]|nr:WYL domain-containing protein [Chloroflexota bacterium]
MHGASLISLAESGCTLLPSAHAWLHRPAGEQRAPFLELLACDSSWKQALAILGLQETIPQDYAAYIQQCLMRQEAAGPTEPEPARWMEAGEPEAWWICLPASLPTWLLFDLLQLGEWEPGQPLRCTPLTLAAASRRGYGYQQIQWLLETACQRPLPDGRGKELQAWLKHGRSYQVRTVQLLSTAQPGQLAEILRQKRWRPYFQQQIGPRHAIVNSELLPQLEQWLAQRGYALDNLAGVNTAPGLETTVYNWLGLRVLVELRTLLPLPYPAPYAQLESLSEQLTPLQLDEMDALAESIVDQIRQAIRGRDAFWPAQKSASQAWLEQITQAIEKDRCLEILYQSLAERQPGYRRIQPLRLEQQGELYYLHAYCYRTEANLVFRLDRIHELSLR